MPDKYLSGETWLPVAKSIGLYSVSNIGNVRSHIGMSGGRILKPSLIGRGYYQVHLNIKTHVYDRLVHRLVAEAFIGPCPKGKEVNHKNGNRRDNRVENLEYVTHRENLLHARDVLGVSFGRRTRQAVPQ